MVKLAAILGIVLGLIIPLTLADLRVGFYDTTCPNAEAIIRQVVQKTFTADRSITAALLRMHFHDCFVRGCDASILIDSTNTSQLPGFFRDRLSNFKGTGKPDPSTDPTLVAQLSKTCQSGSGGADPTAFLDQNTSFVFDNVFYKQILAKKGILQIDQELATDKSSVGIVSRFAADSAGFRQSFAAAMVKMAGVEVLTGTAGEIRKNCRVLNQAK